MEATPGGKPEEWKTVIPEGKDVINGSSIVGGKLFVTRLHDVKTETTIYTLDGRATGRIDDPGIGLSTGGGTGFPARTKASTASNPPSAAGHFSLTTPGP